MADSVQDARPLANGKSPIQTPDPAVESEPAGFPGGIRTISWGEVDSAARKLARRQAASKHRGVWGVPTGGSVVAPFVAKYLKVPVVPLACEATLVVDDLVDSGRTLQREFDRHPGVAKFGFGKVVVDALFRKSCSPQIAVNAVELEGWLHFPWEREARPEDAVVRLLQFIGEDPTREGLVDTPARVCKAWREMTSGYADDPDAILSKVFAEDYDELIISRAIPFVSNCEHHMLVFHGTVDIGYIPGPKGVVGLSKLARLVDCFSRRLQVQERMTTQIANAIENCLGARGVGVVVRASHSCQACRGVRKHSAEMVTSVCLGALREKGEARAEFLSLCRG